jgi:putative ABC transport system permease protein
MFRNYFIIAFRNLWKNKIFSLINILGLAVSMSVCLLLIMMLNDMYSYDRFHPQGNQIYRVITKIESKADKQRYGVASTTLAMVNGLKTGFGQNIEFAQLNRSMTGEVISNEQNFVVKNGFYASPEFLKIFHFPLAQGNQATALQEPNSLVITHTLAQKMFKNDNPIGKIVELKDQGNFKITGVLRPLEGKTHLDFEMLGSLKTLERLEKEKKIEPVIKNWTNVWMSYIYIKIPDNQQIANIQSELNRLAKKNIRLKEDVYTFELQQLQAITPGPDLGNQTGKYMPDIIVYFLIGFVGIVLFSACFNYANLSTARALTRAKEVGLRKVIGAYRWQLVAQFLIEASVFSILAFLLACVILEIVWLPGFHTLGIMQKELGLDYKQDFNAYFQFFLVSLLIGLIAGISPAVYLSAFKPIQVLKGIPNLKLTTRRLPIRKALIVIQFTISLAFVLTTFVIYRQAHFLLGADYGFNKDNLVRVVLHDVNPTVFRQEIASNPAVKDISFSSHSPAGQMNRSLTLKIPGGKAESVFWYGTDEHFVQAFQLKIVAGEGFSTANNKNENNIILNEKAIKLFNLSTPQKAIGTSLYLDDDSSYVRVVGVVKDFIHQNLANEIRPLALRYEADTYEVAVIRLMNPNRKAIMEFLESKWAKLDKQHPLEAQFYNDMLANHPINQIFDAILKIIGVVAFLAVLIAALGLLGMVIYLTEIRTKEIGLRKVLGANLEQLIFLLAKGFIIMLSIAILLALPLAWFVNGMWLNFFAYKVSIGWEFLAFGIGLIVFLGCIIIIPQTFKIARLNPVDVLRNE